MIARKLLIFIYSALICFVSIISAGCSTLNPPDPNPSVTLRFLYEKNIADYDALAKEFQKEYPYITIELVTYTNMDDWYRNYETLMESADAARLFSGQSLYYNQHIPDGILPLDNFISSDLDFPYDNLFPNLLDGMRQKGNLIGLPSGINPFVIYINYDKFAAAGVEIPTPGWTVEDFVITAATVHNPNPNALSTSKESYGFCTNYEGNDPSIFLYLFGGRLVDDIQQPTSPQLNQKTNLDALQWYTGLFNDHEISLPIDRIQQIDTQIKLGNCAMWMDVLSRGTYGSTGNFEAMPLPLPVYNVPITIAAVDNYNIMSQSTHKQEAWLWIRFLMENELAAGKLLPPLRKLSQPEPLDVSTQSRTRDMAQILPENLLLIGPQNDDRMQQLMMQYYQAVQRVLKGETDVETALEQAQQEAIKNFTQ